MNRIRGALAAIPAAFLLAAPAAPAAENENKVLSASGTRMQADVTYLADDAQEGRGAGTKGLDRAADYIAKRFEEIGLKTAPGADGYFQDFTIPGKVDLGADEAQSLKVAGPGDFAAEAKVKADFTPLAVGIGGKVEKADIVFVGYGITAKDDALKLEYDDYAGLDVKGKVVLMLRREPQLNDEESKFGGRQTTAYATFRHKATNAFQHEAAAVVLVNDKAGLKGGEDQLVAFEAAGGGGSRVPFVMATRAWADALLKAAGKPALEEIEEKIDADLKPQSFPLDGFKADLAVDIKRDDYKLKNVIGVLEGSGPLADETIIIGGHYDHLGNGVQGGSLSFGSTDIHNGADDNASGTAMFLELARRLAHREDPLPRRVVFMGFSGEELGLLGSHYYCEHPLYPLDKTIFMVNFDMVGRLSDESALSILGVGTSEGMGEILESLGTAAGFKLKLTAGASDGLGGSDHQSFMAKRIPVAFFFTGLHGQYHRPSDDTPLINFDGMSRIADLTEQVTLGVVTRPERPAYTTPRRGAPKVAKAEGPAAAHDHGADNPHAADPGEKPKVGDLQEGRAWLGTQPDYGDEGGKGVKLGGVTEGSPAEKAGLTKGDLIVEFGGKKIGTLDDFMDSLMRHKAGETVEIGVLRDGKDVKVKATLGTRQAN
jgi:hypothetical protein